MVKSPPLFQTPAEYGAVNVASPLLLVWMPVSFATGSW
jgi:hypothetical protein